SDYVKHLYNGPRRLDGCGLPAGRCVFDLAHNRGKTPQPPHERTTPKTGIKRLRLRRVLHPDTSCPGTEQVTSFLDTPHFPEFSFSSTRHTFSSRGTDAPALFACRNGSRNKLSNSSGSPFSKSSNVEAL